ncbi:MAG TPA: LLM class flavin-dependent oxidoreductase, partial [Acidimicrobiia bacterium]|nr:LLM class flavin-dependent oxidoreductase [Acidimicrobiia bacterium]
LGAGDDESLVEDVAFGVLDDGAPIGSSALWAAEARAADPPHSGFVPAGPVASGPFAGLSRPNVGRYRVARLAATVEALSGRGYPVWVAGASPAAVRVAVTADGWNSWGGTPSRYRVVAGRVRTGLHDAGRDPAGFTFTWGGLAVMAATADEARAKSERLGGDRPGVVTGTPPEVAERLAANAAAGAAWVILGPVDSADPANAALLGEAAALLRPGT